MIQRALNRRQFLKWMIIVAISGIGTLSILKSRIRLIPDILRSPELNTQTPRGQLEEKQLQNIVALSAILIPKDETPGADEIWVREYVNHKTINESGYLLEYQNGAMILDELAENLTSGLNKFSELPLSTRDEILKQYFRSFQVTGILNNLILKLGRISSPAMLKERFWRFVVREIIYDFYSSPAGWAVVGYTNYPGVPGDPRAYTEALKSS